jgi:quercetin dioxygenase-like cupin family protein
MKRELLAAMALICVAPGIAFADGKIVRTELTRADAPGSATHEVIVARLEIQPGGTVPLHTHHGDEHLIIIQGGPMKTAGGKTVNFSDGMVSHFLQGKVHGGLTSMGKETVIAYTTHIVEKGKPLSIPAN